MEDGPGWLTGRSARFGNKLLDSAAWNMGARLLGGGAPAPPNTPGQRSLGISASIFWDVGLYVFGFWPLCFGRAGALGRGCRIASFNAATYIYIYIYIISFVITYCLTTESTRGLRNARLRKGVWTFERSAWNRFWNMFGAPEPP